VSTPADSDLVVLGRISGVYGIKGWLKVWSFTDPLEGILDYPAWHLKTASGWEVCEIDAGRRQGKGVVVHLPGCDDRDQAQRFLQAEIAVPRAALPELEDGEYYWNELEGLAGAGAAARRHHGAAGPRRSPAGDRGQRRAGGAGLRGQRGPARASDPLGSGAGDPGGGRAQRELLVDWDPEF